MEEQVLTMLRDDVGAIMLGTVFLFVGVISCAISALPPRKGKRILLWFGLLNVMWGVRILAYEPAAFSMLPVMDSAWRLKVGFVAGGPSRTEHPELDHMDAGAGR